MFKKLPKFYTLLQSVFLMKSEWILYEFIPSIDFSLNIIILIEAEDEEKEEEINLDVKKSVFAKMAELSLLSNSLCSSPPHMM